MRFVQTIIFIFAVSFPGLAQAAFPIVPIGAIDNQNCLYTSEQRTFAELIHKVNVMGRDDRGPLTTMGPAVGLSQQEIQRIRKTTGYVYCPGTKYHNGGTASGTLISNGQILTVAHAFYDPHGRKRAPWSACYFEAQTGGQMKKIYFSFGNGKSIFESHNRLGTVEDLRRDVAILTLKTRVSGVEPFEMSSEPITLDEKIYGISAGQAGYQKDWREPIIETCAPQQVFIANGETPSGYYSNCDSEHGDSGGVNLVRRNGRLVIVGILENGGDSSKDGQPYDPQSGSYTYSIGIDGEFAKKAAEFSGVKLDDGPSSPLNSTKANNI